MNERIEQAIEAIAQCVTTDGSFGFEDAKVRQILVTLVDEALAEGRRQVLSEAKRRAGVKTLGREAL